jgi:uridine phosphorylase
VTSAGRILPIGDPPYFVLIERAWRDEGTSMHYLPRSQWAASTSSVNRCCGASWTTDAPFRETPSAIAAAEAAGVHAVEMEAAGLYAYAMAMCRDTGGCR